MNIIIKPYSKSDKSYFAKYLREIYKYLEERDPYNKLVWDDTFTEFQADDELTNVEKNNGEIFMALDTDHIIGMIVISMPEKTRSVVKMHVPSIDGKIDLLYVEESYRKKGIGKMLLEYGEARLKERGCNYVSLEVMPINDSYSMYKHFGYTDRSVAMLKKLS